MVKTKEWRAYCRRPPRPKYARGLPPYRATWHPYSIFPQHVALLPFAVSCGCFQAVTEALAPLAKMELTGDSDSQGWFSLLLIVCSSGSDAHAFPVAAIINYYKHGRLKQHEFIIYSLEDRSPKVQVIQGWCHLMAPGRVHVLNPASRDHLSLGSRPLPSSLEQQCSISQSLSASDFLSAWWWHQAWNDPVWLLA
jgi:hypothetical protein